MRGTTNVRHFWEWFARHRDQYRELLKGTLSKPDKKYWEDELAAHLRSHCRRLYVNMIQAMGQQTIVLTITAHGNHRFFRKAETLVKYAPTLTDWAFQALSPPGHLEICEGEQLELARIEADVSEIWFQTHGVDSYGWQNITLFVPYVLPNRERDVYFYVRWFLFNLLGERLAGSEFIIRNVLPRAHADGRKKLHRIDELPELLSRQVSKIGIGADGKITTIRPYKF